MSRGWGPRTGRPLPEAMVLKEPRSNSQIPTPFPHRFLLNSHALTSVEGLLGQDKIDAAIQTMSTSKARRVDFGGCGPLQPPTGGAKSVRGPFSTDASQLLTGRPPGRIRPPPPPPLPPPPPGRTT